LNAGRNMPKVNPNIQKIIDARHHDPFSVLGRHRSGDSDTIRAFMPLASEMAIMPNNLPMERLSGTDIFEWKGNHSDIPQHYQLQWRDHNGNVHTYHDPYTFPPQLGDLDLHLFSEGKHWHAYRFLGAHLHTVDGIAGVQFGVWAPNAERVSVVGDFNRWDGRCHPMRSRNGVWELFIPDLPTGTLYKYEIRNRDSGHVYLKSDPYGQGFELRPQTSTYIIPESKYHWQDQEWITARAQRDWVHVPMSVYELHLGSWRRDGEWKPGDEGHFLNYRDLAHQLVEYVTRLGFTHIELLPVAEHPLDASWGYQVTGFFAPSSRFGSPDEFRYFVDYCHQHQIGVILDWVPAHFPKDAHGLAWFDGTALYEHGDPRLGEHLDWGTLIFNYGRYEVKNFLISNAVYWLEEFHIDGLRVDAVASMLYLDYSRPEGQWIPNKYGGRENLEAIDFLRELNTITHSEFPGTLTMAEESTSWPQVTRPTYVGGLGFSMKWNMGWMHDTLLYMSKDPVHRRYHHDHLTFGMLYAFTENFVLPFSHDEVVHGKCSMIDKMPGDAWQKFANLRLLYTYMWTYPGKKLLFMGDEFAHGIEWNCATPLSWELLERDIHIGIHTVVKDLNQLYQQYRPLHHHDFEGKGFSWIDCHDADQSVISYVRHYINDETKDYEEVLILLNFTPIPRHNYHIGVAHSGVYREIFNSDSKYYGGSDVGNGELTAQEPGWMGYPYSLYVTLPPLAGIVLRRKYFDEKKIEEENTRKKLEEQAEREIEARRKAEEDREQALKQAQEQKLQKELAALEAERQALAVQRKAIEEREAIEEKELKALEARKALEQERRALEEELKILKHQEDERKALEEELKELSKISTESISASETTHRSTIEQKVSGKSAKNSKHTKQSRKTNKHGSPSVEERKI